MGHTQTGDDYIDLHCTGRKYIGALEPRLFRPNLLSLLRFLRVAAEQATEKSVSLLRTETATVAGGLRD